jgi:uncharacterized delta-60 repeat protein
LRSDRRRRGQTGGAIRLAGALAFAAVLFGVVATALAVAGDLDQSFSNDGVRVFGFHNGSADDGAAGVAIERDGRIVLAGGSDQSQSGADFAIAMLRSGGGFASGFSGDGRRVIGFGNGSGADGAAGVAIQGDGKIVAAGGSDQGGNAQFAVARVRQNGALDKSFSGDGRRTFGFGNGTLGDGAAAVAIQHDGKIVVVGGSDQGGNGQFAVTRLLPDGRFDKSFSGDGRRTFGFKNGTLGDGAAAVAIQRDGRIVVAGGSAQTGTGGDFAVARLLPSGSFDDSFSGDGRRTFGFGNGAGGDGASGLAIDGAGRIVVIGSTDQVATGQDFGVARLRPGGGFDTSFSADGQRLVNFDNVNMADPGSAVAIDRGKIVVAGSSGQGAIGSNFAIARLRSNGNYDPSFSGDGKQLVEFNNGSKDDGAAGFAIQGGRIVVAGDSERNTTGDDFAVARLLG